MLQQLLIALVALPAIISVVSISKLGPDIIGMVRAIPATDAQSNATRRWLSAEVEKKDVCTIVVRDKIRGHLNWMQVIMWSLLICNAAHKSNYCILLKDWFQKVAKSKCNQVVRITENNAEVL